MYMAIPAVLARSLASCNSQEEAIAKICATRKVRGTAVFVLALKGITGSLGRIPQIIPDAASARDDNKNMALISIRYGRPGRLVGTRACNQAAQLSGPLFMNNYKQENRERGLRSSLFLRPYLRPVLPLSARMRPARFRNQARDRRLPRRDLSILTIETCDSQSLMSRSLIRSSSAIARKRCRVIKRIRRLGRWNGRCALIGWCVDECRENQTP